MCGCNQTFCTCGGYYRTCTACCGRGMTFDCCSCCWTTCWTCNGAGRIWVPAFNRPIPAPAPWWPPRRPTITFGGDAGKHVQVALS